jgi:hypothetical protein
MSYAGAERVFARWGFEAMVGIVVFTEPAISFA